MLDLVRVTRQVKTQARKESKSSGVSVQMDEVIQFRQLKSKRAVGTDSDEYGMDLTRATGLDGPETDFVSKLSRISPLTGEFLSRANLLEKDTRMPFMSKPMSMCTNTIFFWVSIFGSDKADILIVNQTADTLQNLTVEFSTLGDLKLVERPAPHTLAPHSFHSIKANIKVSSTETGVIFGHVVYEGTSALDMKYVVLNELQVDILDYIKPATCTETQFRSMWTEFEWENKINISMRMRYDLQELTCSNLRACLDHLMKSTHTSCLTPENALLGDCGFLAANLYARSLFGEDALANISLEQLENDCISGHVRIRSKTQGIALSLGDKVSLCQKNFQ